MVVEIKVWIILGSVLGALVVTLALVLILACCTRIKRRRPRLFSLRAVTPLDDAEFESWRRPSQYTKRPESYGIRPTRPSVARTNTSAMMFEKDISLYNSPNPQPYNDRTPPRSLSESESTTSPIKVPERVRRKSSVSLQDRPPTPYSPTSPRQMDLPSRRESRGSIHSSHHIHYPSVSEASDFDFGFGTSPPQYDQQHRRESERRLYTRPRQRSDL